MSVKSVLTSPVRDLIPETGLGRRYAMSSLINSVGEGMFVSGTAVFATRAVGLSPAQVGWSLGAAGVAGIVGAGTMGTLADRFGARRMILIMSVLQAVGYIGYCFVRSFPLFLVLTCALDILAFGKSPASASLVSSITGERGRIRLRAQARSLFNIGFSLGSGLAAVAIAVATMPAYYSLPVGDAATYLVAAAIVRTLPETAVGSVRRRSFGALRNVPFLTTTAVNTVLALHGSLTLIVVPLWIISRTDAPRALTGILLVVNTAIVMLFQVRSSTGTDTLAGSVRKARWAAAVLFPSCVLVGISGGLGVLPAIAVLLCVYVLLSVGEMWQTSSAWGMAYSLAPVHAQGEYMGAFAMSMAAQTFIGTTVGIWLVFGYGAFGWWLWGLSFVAAAAVLGPVAGWASRRLVVLHGTPVPVADGAAAR